jgi:hypothetical protein
VAANEQTPNITAYNLRFSPVSFTILPLKKMNIDMYWSSRYVSTFLSAIRFLIMFIVVLDYLLIEF